MSYQIQLPNGSFVEVDDSVPQERARAMVMQQFPEQFSEAHGFVPAVKGGFKSGIGSTIRGVGELVSEGLAGGEEAGQGIKNYSREWQDAAQSTFVPTPESEKGIGALLRRNLTEPIGGMIGEFGPTMAASAATTAVAGPAAGGALFYASLISSASVILSFDAASGFGFSTTCFCFTAFARTVGS